MATDHPAEHNAIKDTLDDIIAENAGALPLSGGTVTGDLQVGGNLTVKAGGGTSNPAIAFDGLDGMGIYSSVQNNYMRFGVAGGQRLAIKETVVIANDDLQVDGQTLAADGTKAAPAYSFASDKKTGIWYNSAGQNVVSIASDGENVANFGKTGVTLASVSNTTGSPPNVYIANDGQLFRSTWNPTRDAVTSDEHNTLRDRLAAAESTIDTLQAAVDSLTARLEAFET